MNNNIREKNSNIQWLGNKFERANKVFRIWDTSNQVLHKFLICSLDILEEDSDDDNEGIRNDCIFPPEYIQGPFFYQF